MCAQAEPVVARAAADAGVPLEVRDVDADPADHALLERQGPVVLLDGVEHAYWSIDERVLRKACASRPGCEAAHRLRASVHSA
jgi:hypothetical protein